jgi:hypothetical protein
VLKKSESGTTILDSSDDDGSIAIFNGGNEVTNWDGGVTYTKESSDIHLYLKSANGSFTWDEEVIEFVKNGDSAVSYSLSISPNKINKADIPSDGKEVEIVVTKHSGGKSEVITDGYNITRDDDKSGFKITDTTVFTLSVGGVQQDVETVEVTPIMYGYEAVASPSSITIGEFPDEIIIDLKKAAGGKVESITSSDAKYIGWGFDDETITWSGNNGTITVDKSNFSGNTQNFTINIYTSD